MKARYYQFDRIGFFFILNYLRYTGVNPRNGRIMSKEQHWYRVTCNCGHIELRAQQELVDPRRVQACKECRSAIYKQEAIL